MTARLVGEKRVILAALSTILALSLSTLSLAVPASAATGSSGSDVTMDVPSGNVTVEVVANNGSGCPPGTATVSANSDKTGFRIRYFDFIAEAGSGASVVDRRKNCQISVLVTVPAGWTFAIASVLYQGRARLSSGASGLHRTTYYWQGSSQNFRTERDFDGPFNGLWTTQDVDGASIYTPCTAQRILNVNTELRVDAGTSTGRNSLSMRTTEGDVDTLFNFNWVPC